MDIFQSNTNKNHLENNILQSIALQKHLAILSMDCDALHTLTEHLFDSNPAIDFYSFSSHISLETVEHLKKPQTDEEELEQVPLELLSSKYQTLTLEIFAHFSKEGFLEALDQQELLEKWGLFASTALKLIQEKTGLGFPNRLEFFKWQLRKKKDTQHVIDMLDAHEHDLIEGNISKILKKLQIDSHAFETHYLSHLKALKISPKNVFSDHTTYHRIDARILSIHDHFDIEITNLIPSYVLTQSILSENQELRSFYKSHVEEIRIHVEGLKKREQTLQKVLEALIELQKDYLSGATNVPLHIHPETLAKKMGMHPSTLARCVRNKSILCSHGVIALKNLVRPQVLSDNKMSLLLRLKELVAKEDKKAPYSDVKLLELLRTKGAKISRRTLTKYRHKLKIPDARRRFFN